MVTTTQTRNRMEPERRDGRGLGDLIKELRDETTMLLRQEVALAKTEMSEKASRTGRNVGYLAAGALVAFLGLVFLVQAVSHAVEVGLQAAGVGAAVAYWAAPLIVGFVIALIGYGLVQKAINVLKHESAVPEKTVHSLKEDKQWLQEKTG